MIDFFRKNSALPQDKSRGWPLIHQARLTDHEDDAKQLPWLYSRMLKHHSGSDDKTESKEEREISKAMEITM